MLFGEGSTESLFPGVIERSSASGGGDKLPELNITSPRPAAGVASFSFLLSTEPFPFATELRKGLCRSSDRGLRLRWTSSSVRAGEGGDGSTGIAGTTDMAGA